MDNLNRGTPKSVVREEMESLNIRVQGVEHFRSGRRDPDHAKDHHAKPTSLCLWCEGVRFQKFDPLPNSAACECRWSRSWPRKARCNASAASAPVTRFVTANTHRDASLVGLLSLRWMLYPAGGVSVLWLRMEPHNDRGGLNWKETKATLFKQAPEPCRKSVATDQPAAPKAHRAGPSAEEMYLGEGRNHVVRGGVSSRLTQLHPTTHILHPFSAGQGGSREAYSDRQQGDG